MGAFTVEHRPLPLEESLHEPVHEHGLGGHHPEEADAAIEVAVGAWGLRRADEEPDETEVTELGDRVDDAVERLAAAEVVEQGVHLVVEPADGGQRLGRGQLDAEGRDLGHGRRC